MSKVMDALKKEFTNNITLSSSEFMQASENCSGYCALCNSLTMESGVEPDAEQYNCPVCNTGAVIGMDNALLSGYVIIKDKEGVS